MIEGLLVPECPESLCCVLEQDTLSMTRNRSDMTEKLLTGT